MKIISVKIGKSVYRVKDCKNLLSVRGLMFDSMDRHDGALIYANNIWMPFVKKELNLVFLDKNMTVMSQQTAVPLTFNPSTWKVYKDYAAKYCLELKKTGVKFPKGTKLKLGP